MMRYTLCILALCVWTAAALKAASPFPELDAITSKNAANLAALADSSARQSEGVRSRYLLALATARQEMQKANRGGAVVAIDAELADAKKEVHGPPPPDLPPTLAPARRDFLAGLGTLEKASQTRKEELRKQYLADLNRLAQLATVQKNQTLADAVAKEIAGANVPSGPAVAVGLHRNAVVNGTFTDDQTGGMPMAWKPSGETFQGDKVPWQNDAQIVQEGAEKFLRFRRSGSVRLSNVACATPILVPDRAKAAVVTAKARVEGLVPGKDYDRFPHVLIRTFDVAGKSPGSAAAAVQENSKSWKRITAHLVLQPGAKTLEVVAGPAAATGVCDFDDIEVRFE